MALLREAGGLLRIEDVLPLFPDFVTIDAFKVHTLPLHTSSYCMHVYGMGTAATHASAPHARQAAIVDSLQRYSAQIEDLKRDMDEATQIAGACV